MLSTKKQSLMKRETPQNANHQVRASRTPNSQKFKHHGASSLPASRREHDSLAVLENHRRANRPTMSTNSSRTASVAMSKDTPPKNSRAKKPPVPGHRTLEQFYSGAKDQKSGVNSLFSPVLSNMHKGSSEVLAKQDKVIEAQ